MSGRGGDLVHFDQRIIRDPKICGGEPVFKGTRVSCAPCLLVSRPAIHPRRSWLTFPALPRRMSKLQLHSRLHRLKRICPYQPFREFNESETR